MLEFCTGLFFGAIDITGVIFALLSDCNRRTGGYQPDGHIKLDWTKPPKGGSGVPSSQSDNWRYSPRAKHPPSSETHETPASPQWRDLPRPLQNARERIDYKESK